MINFSKGKNKDRLKKILAVVVVVIILAMIAATILGALYM